MEYNVSHLLKSPVGTMREYDLDAGMLLRLAEDVTATVVGGHVRFDRTNTGVLARGHVAATVAVQCARCLDPVDTPVSSDFTEEFEPSVDVSSGRPLAEPDNDLVFTIDEHHLLDLGEPLRQNLLASLPIRPLCSDDCMGLCPTCGANRNVEPCDCPTGEENHPLAALADLLRETS